jgi:hypothetical protein
MESRGTPKLQKMKKINIFNKTKLRCKGWKQRELGIQCQEFEHTVKNLNGSLAECSKSDKVIHVI